MKGALQWIAALLTVTAVCLSAFPAGAAATAGFTYDSYDEAVPSRGGYEAARVLTGAQIDAALGNFSAPQDLCVDSRDGAIYILDSGNNRIVILEADLRLRGVIDRCTMPDGTAAALHNPTGLFVTAERLYIADPGGQQVLITDKAGRVQQRITRPETELLADDVEFAPRRVLADSAGNVYVTVVGVYQGAVLFDAAGSFRGFFGSNEVQITAGLLLDRLWKSLLSQQQADNISRYIPEEFTSFDVDGDDFFYTVTQSDEVTRKLKKLNPMGHNILQADSFGERETAYVNGKLSASHFTDVSVSDAGNIVVLDQQNNRLFEYDSEGNLLFICGGAGQQAGTFRTPVAVETVGNHILVLDAAKNNVTLFEETPFAAKVHAAVAMYGDGLYKDAAELWREILRYDKNYTLAYISLGKALMADKAYAQAAECFRLGGDRAGNSDAFKEYRNALLQKYFPVVCIVIVGLLALLIWWYNRPHKEDWQKVRKKGAVSPFRMLLHPYDTADEIKRNNTGSMLYAWIILVLWFAGTVVQVSLTDFRFNHNRAEDLNILLLFLRTVPLFLVWVVANWGVCTLLDGKGRMKEIFITNAYCLIPHTVSLFLYTALSRWLVDDENMFLLWVSYLGAGWSLFMLLGALAAIHEYFAGKTVGSVALSVLGVLIVIFLLLLVASLLQKGWSFVYSILNEILFRIR